ncbi:1-acyl-sn-glycerol-3-phosphate acyltransferase [Achlya hypogyna]|uniref:1-acyl-sn-glycerol-3-phosphate acyltransferase n=1 Tax=Achlya hypogyna TaxID=1202772 RepID=A0A1V9YEY7_ACHHY|nr:1-acyl-sn-glycerol-3-phosphate acyltransferase [Achlya hypogyna]
MDLSRLLSPCTDDDVVSDATSVASMSPPSSPVLSAASAPPSPTGSLSSASSLSSTNSGLRTGKWFYEEEQYALALVECFLLSYFPALPAGSSLRLFLADKLSCSPMRISKKLSREPLELAGVALPKKLGQQRYLEQPIDSAQRTRTLQHLAQLETTFHRCLAHEHRLASPQEAQKRGFVDLHNANSMHRTGYWFREEQVYAWKLIDFFLKGHLRLRKGTTLRAYLAEQLGCSPMRISKKLASGLIGGKTIPKKVGTATYRPQAKHTAEFTQAALKAEAELAAARAACFAFKSNPAPYTETAMSTPLLLLRRAAMELRRGMWTDVEDSYALALIEGFLQGCFGSVAPGTSLRCFLAKRLRCSPMRISKRLAFYSLSHNVNLPQKVGKLRYSPSRTLSPERVRAALGQIQYLQSVFEKTQTPPQVLDDRPLSSPDAPRVGMWLPQEQAHAYDLIRLFLKGDLPLARGTTLRAFLATELNCSPMRISKKLATTELAGRKLPKRIGSAMFVPKEHRVLLKQLQMVSPTAYALGRLCGLWLLLHVVLLNLYASLFMVLKPFNRPCFRQLIATYCLTDWIACLLLCFKRSRLILSGDALPTTSRPVILLANHQVDADWWYLLQFVAAQGALPQLKLSMKASLRLVPFMGWAMAMLEFLFLDRALSTDRARVQRYMESFISDGLPVWLVLFPEGTTIHTEYVAKSHSFAQRKDRPIFNRVLLPRVAGLQLLLDAFAHSSIKPEIYDVTIGYPGYTGEVPTYSMGYSRRVDVAVPSMRQLLAGGGPSHVHLHVTRHACPEVDLLVFLDRQWAEKDRLLNAFISTQQRSSIELAESVDLEPSKGQFSFCFVMDLAFILAPMDDSAPDVRMGVWLPEEEDYMLALIECFTAGLLPKLTPATSLRSFLARKLRCAPMRVSKKIASFVCATMRNIGRSHYEPARRLLSEADRCKMAHLAKTQELFQRAIQPHACVGRTKCVTAMDDTNEHLTKTTRGFWFHYEQLYAAKLIEYFVQGALQIPCGVTLRGYLAERLQCSPMRVSKKLATGSLAGRPVPRRIGTAVFVPYHGISFDKLRLVDAELAQLRKDCFAHKAHSRRWMC